MYATIRMLSIHDLVLIINVYYLFIWFWDLTVYYVVCFFIVIRAFEKCTSIKDCLVMGHVGTWHLSSCCWCVQHSEFPTQFSSDALVVESFNGCFKHMCCLIFDSHLHFILFPWQSNIYWLFCYTVMSIYCRMFCND